MNAYAAPVEILTESTRRVDAWERYLPERQDSTAEEEIVTRHLPLVKTVVGRLAMSLPAHVDGDDLHSAGLVGLLNAVRNYDPACRTSFETYARLRIRGAVLDELRRMDWVPRSIHTKARQVQATIQELEQALGRVPEDTEVARKLKITPLEYEQILEEIKPATFVCLDASPRNDEGSYAESIADDRQVPAEEQVARLELAGLIAKRLEQLPEMQRKVMALYYFEDLRLREIAAAFGLTESRICQIHGQAILAIKAYLAGRGVAHA